MSGESLIGAALSAPLVGIAPTDRDVMHAITMEAVIEGWERGSVVSACGVAGLKLASRGEVDASVPWPPRVDSLPKGMTRCRSCHVATGRKRPRSKFVRNPQATPPCSPQAAGGSMGGAPGPSSSVGQTTTEETR